MTGRARECRKDDGGEQYYEFIGFDTNDDVRDESEHHTGGEFI